MSGTSLDGIDVAVIDLAPRNSRVVVRLTAFETIPWPLSVRQDLLQLCRPNSGSTADIGFMNFLVGRLFAEALLRTCRKHRIPPGSIDLIGSHGQTIWHDPKGRRFGRAAVPSTLQIGEPAVIAQRTGITTVADFRTADLAAGGQGAPLVPYSDFVLFRHTTKSRAIQNIGGIGNVTWLPARCTIDEILAFDTGPGNMVIDGLVDLFTQGKQTYDPGGRLAANGTVHRPLLAQMLRHPYFRKEPPKSTGREDFGILYCHELLKLARRFRLRNEDVLITVTAFTAQTIADAYRRFLPRMPDEIYLAGGGAHNRTLVRMLADLLPDIPLRTTDELGIPIDAREAVAFAILARASALGSPNNVPSATGAKRPVILGKIVPVP
ncbi:MAG: anhydro-N-acetylmuramic acid kinase [Phycisphaerae bacterium]|nr:anhydro-N-acetylmuramic acid kinase [Phycisphaerae bacterium]